MGNEIERRIRELKDLTIDELRTRYEALTGEGSRSSNRRHLTRRIAWRIQAKQEGGLSRRALQRAEDLADVEGLRLSASKARDVSAGSAKTKQQAGRDRVIGATSDGTPRLCRWLARAIASRSFAACARRS